MDSYEKKYKEMKARVLEIGQGYVKGVDFSKPRQIAEYIDPELVESEDERIRTALLNHLKKMWGNANDDVCGVHVEDVIAWLEKQGEHKQWVHVDPISEEDKLHLMFDGQKPADKVEPRFHEGDWVSCNSDNLRSPLRIVSFSYTEYKVEDTQGVPGRPKIEYLDKHYHLWTIQDAKDGDVLTTDMCTFIFKHECNGDAFMYCGYSLANNRFCVSDTSTVNVQYVHPAIKVQRDILFKKMNEANYEWDAERKELCPLSKSEATSDQVTQQSTLDVKNETAEKLIALAECLEMDGDCLFNGLSGNNYGKFLRVLAKELTEIKPAEWSEEDEKLIDEVAVCLRKYEEKVQGGYSKFYVQSLADRIESLRPGNTCKATEWSDDDDAMFQGVIETEQYMLDVVYGRKIFAVGNEDIKEECTKELSWLKSLKDRIK